MANPADTRVSIDQARRHEPIASASPASAALRHQDILPDIISGLKEVLLRVEAGEDLGKIAASLGAPEEAFRGPGISLVSGSPLPSQPAEHIAQIACFPTSDATAESFIFAASAGYLELLQGNPDDAGAYAPIARVPHTARVTSVQVAEEMRLAFSSTARPARGGVSVRSLQQDSLLVERAFLPVSGDATALALSRLVPTVAVAHGNNLSVFDVAALKPAPVIALQGRTQIASLTAFSHAPMLGVGSVAGDVNLLDLREKASLLQHTRYITALDPLTPVTMLSASADAALCVWDLRRTAEPLRSLIPDGRSIISCAVRPNKSGAAVATLQGLYYADLAHLHLSALAFAPPPAPAEAFPCLSWASSRLYALHLSGSLLLFE